MTSAPSSPATEEPVDILVVDDNPDVLRAMAAILDLPGYNIVKAVSGEDALAKILRHDFALILLDIAMPGMDGFETAKIIKQREQSKRIPIIFVTGYGHEMDQIFRGYTVGAVDYLQKPVDTHQLSSKVAVFVELFRQRKQIQQQALFLREAEQREQQLLRARAEEQLRESETLYRHTFEQAPIGIGCASADGIWRKVNRRLCELVGRRPEELLGQKCFEIVADAARHDLADALDRLRVDGTTPYTAEHALVAASGAQVSVRLTIQALRDGAEGLVVVVDQL